MRQTKKDGDLMGRKYEDWGCTSIFSGRGRIKKGKWKKKKKKETIYNGLLILLDVFVIVFTQN